MTETIDPVEMKTQTPENAQYIRAIILICSDGANKIINEAIAQLPTEMQWLVKARIVNSIFASFYQPTFKMAETALNREGVNEMATAKKTVTKKAKAKTKAVKKKTK